MFIDISLVVVENPRDLLCVTIHQLKILLFPESDDRSQNAGKTKGRTFLTDLIFKPKEPNGRNVVVF